jgi:RNA polymerase sigma factor (sigma-70 family)
MLAKDFQLTALLSSGSTSTEAVREVEQCCRMLLRSKFAGNRLAREQEEDLVQDALMASFRQARKIDEGHSRPVENVTAWLARVVMNLVWRTWHKEGDGQGSSLDEPMIALLETPDSLPQPERLAVRQALFRLDEKCRNLLWQREVLGVARSVLAEQLGTKSNALGVRLHRCRKKLLELYQRELGEES